MKNKIALFIINNWILLLFLSIFTVFILPPCFQNNENINIVLAEHIDSGSILGSIMQMNSKNTPHSFYNQNIPYHTGYYGYPYNSIVFWNLKLIKIFFRSYASNNFYVFPLTAKLLNFIFATLSIIYLWVLSQKILKHNLSKILLFLLVLIFPEYLHYVFHIKPDILGLLFSLISLNYLYDYLQNPKQTKNIIKANVLGGLSILCKQPHIFIIIPLFFGFIFTLKGSLKENLNKFIKIYLYSGIIFLFLFFIIHPYAFIELKTFLKKQIDMTGMASASYIDNLNFWVLSYIYSPLLSIIAFSPFLFPILNLIKKFRDKKTYYLGLISLYPITYIIWLSFNVGPMRFIAYLIPIFPFSILFFSYIFDHSLFYFLKNKNIFKKTFYFIIIIFITIQSINCLKYYIFHIKPPTTFTTKHVIILPYNFQKTEMYKSTKQFEKEFSNQQLNKKTIVYSVSLPINSTLYENATNTWQLPTEDSINKYKPDLLFIDFTVYWEKPYHYWKKIAQENQLIKEETFIQNLEKEKNIILFYQY